MILFVTKLHQYNTGHNHTHRDTRHKIIRNTVVTAVATPTTHIDSNSHDRAETTNTKKKKKTRTTKVEHKAPGMCGQVYVLLSKISKDEI